MAFDAITPTKLAQAAVTASPATVYTTPEGTRTFVKDIDIANTGASPVLVTVNLVPSGGSASTDNALLAGVLVKGYNTLQWGGSQILNEGDFISVEANTTGCTIHISGGEAV